MKNKNHQSGFSLVSLTVASGLSLLLASIAMTTLTRISKVNQSVERGQALQNLKNRIVANLDCKETLNRNASAIASCNRRTIISLWEVTKTNGHAIQIVSNDTQNLTRSGKYSILAQHLCGNNGIIIRAATLRKGVVPPNSIQDAKWTDKASYSQDPMTGKVVTFFDPNDEDNVFTKSLALCKNSYYPQSFTEEFRDAFHDVTERDTSDNGWATTKDLVVNCKPNELVIGCSFWAGATMSIPHVIIPDVVNNRCLFQSTFNVVGQTTTIRATCSRYRE